MAKDTNAVIVTYNPDCQALRQLLECLKTQVQQTWVIDNASANQAELANLLPAQAYLIKNTKNMGLGYCYNRAIAYAKQHGAKYIVFFDQDSLPEKTMIHTLRTALEELDGKQGGRVAAVGPRYADVKGKTGFFVRVARLHLQRISFLHTLTDPIVVDHLISSGTLAPLAAFEAIGAFEEKLFIDYVDTEWCLRARANGWSLYGIPWASMQHDLGDSVLKVGRVRICLHTPMRCYYIIRNGLWLLGQPWVSWNWRCIDLIRLTRFFCVMGLLTKTRTQYIRAMLAGIQDAFCARMGPKP